MAPFCATVERPSGKNPEIIETSITVRSGAITSDGFSFLPEGVVIDTKPEGTKITLSPLAKLAPYTEIEIRSTATEKPSFVGGQVDRVGLTADGQTFRAHFKTGQTLNVIHKETI